MKINVFNNGVLYVMKEKCSTCIFHPGNKMHLSEGRVKGMVDDCVKNDTAIICHKTLSEDDQQAVCRGFYDSYQEKITALRFANQLGVIRDREE